MRVRWKAPGGADSGGDSAQHSLCKGLFDLSVFGPAHRLPLRVGRIFILDMPFSTTQDSENM